MERTEDQKIGQEPIQVTFNGAKYEIKLLTIKEASKWRKQAVAILAGLPRNARVSAEDPQAFQNAVQALISDSPDATLDLFFSYAKDLPREEIENTANDAEMATAFEQVLQVGFLALSNIAKLGRAMNRQS
jgi:hypothetical protein